MVIACVNEKHDIATLRD